MANAIGRGRIAPVRAVDFEKTCHLAHSVPFPLPPCGGGSGRGSRSEPPFAEQPSPGRTWRPPPSPPPLTLPHKGGGDFSARICQLSQLQTDDFEPAKR